MMLVWKTVPPCDGNPFARLFAFQSAEGFVNKEEEEDFVPLATFNVMDVRYSAHTIEITVVVGRVPEFLCASNSKLLRRPH
jgi:hypothetical protein